VISLNFHQLPNALEKCLIVKHPWLPQPQQPLLLKTPVFNIAPNFIYHFNHPTFFCINTCAMVLINQYSTGLFVTYYSVQRKIKLYEIKKEYIYLRF